MNYLVKHGYEISVKDAGAVDDEVNLGTLVSIVESVLKELDRDDRIAAAREAAKRKATVGGGGTP